MIRTFQQIGKASRQTGLAAEQVIINHLQSMGALFIQRIETGWKVIRKPIPDGRGGMRTQIVSAIPIRSVAGDIRALCPGGRSILVEVKARKDSLSLSDFEEHQQKSLDEHSAVGGLSLVGWVHPDGVAVIRWPIVGGLVRGRPLSFIAACMLSLPRIPDCAQSIVARPPIHFLPINAAHP